MGRQDSRWISVNPPTPMREQGCFVLSPERTESTPDDPRPSPEAPRDGAHYKPETASVRQNETALMRERSVDQAQHQCGQAACTDHEGRGGHGGVLSSGMLEAAPAGDSRGADGRGVEPPASFRKGASAGAGALWRDRPLSPVRCRYDETDASPTRSLTTVSRRAISAACRRSASQSGSSRSKPG